MDGDGNLLSTLQAYSEYLNDEDDEICSSVEVDDERVQDESVLSLSSETSDEEYAHVEDDDEEIITSSLSLTDDEKLRLAEIMTEYREESDFNAFCFSQEEETKLQEIEEKLKELKVEKDVGTPLSTLPDVYLEQKLKEIDERLAKLRAERQLEEEMRRGKTDLLLGHLTPNM